MATMIEPGMRPWPRDLTGVPFGRWTVKEFAGYYGENPPHKQWLCECECGTIKVVRAANLKRGKSQSCGCFARDRAREANTTHGLSRTKEYQRWASRRRNDRKKLLDTWTFEMEQLLRELQPACLCAVRGHG